jgi:hypothetical protein
MKAGMAGPHCYTQVCPRVVIPAWMPVSSAMACPERSRKGW